jgi:DNA-binding Lrp family transcriptional regulator
MKEEQLLKVLCELMKNSRQSDRAIAEKLEVSQPTITRARAELEKGYIKEYTVIPDFPKIGYEIMAITLVKSKASLSKEIREKTLEEGKRWAKHQQNIAFGAMSYGMGMSAIAISFHKTFSDYIAFKRKLAETWGSVLDLHESLLVDMKHGQITKNFSFSCLTEDFDKR